MSDTMTKATAPNEFRCAFQITRYLVFEVRYHTLGRNPEPYFATETARLNARKSDYMECGQCQERILPAGPARDFWEKWDGKHLCLLTNGEREAVWADIEALKGHYSHIAIASDKFGTEDRRDIRFEDIVRLSKEPMRKTKRAVA